MKLEINFGNEIIKLPAAAALHASDACENDWLLLFALIANPALCDDFNSEKLAKSIGISEAEVLSSLSFWRGAGLVRSRNSRSARECEVSDTKKGSQGNIAAVLSEGKADSKLNTPSNKAQESESDKNGEATNVKVRRSDTLPLYTGAECKRIIDSRPSLRDVIDEAQRIFEKTFSTSDVNTILILADYLGLADEYILLLFTHLKSEDKTSMHTLKTMAFNLFDSGIVKTEELEKHLSELEKSKPFERKVRKLLWIDKPFTEKQKEYIRNWADFGYDFEVISHAAQHALDREPKRIFPYINGILSNWHAHDLKTLADISKFEASGEKPFNKTSSKPKQGVADPSERSFDSDEFFKIAENYSKNKKGESTK